MWTALLASLVTYAVAVSEALRWYALDTSLILASDAVPLSAVGENLRNFTWALLLLPYWWLPFGVHLARHWLHFLAASTLEAR